MARRRISAYHPRSYLRGDSSLTLLVVVTLLASAGAWYYLQQHAATTAAPLVSTPTTAAATVVTSSSAADGSKPAAHAVRQCVDAGGKILWSDQPCPQDSKALALNPSAGTTYSSAESMRPTANMPPVYVPPHSSGGGDVVVVGGDSTPSAPSLTYEGRRSVYYCCRPAPAYTVISPPVTYSAGQPSQSMSAHVPTRMMRPLNDMHY
jgi:hypothetical protein